MSIICFLLCFAAQQNSTDSTKQLLQSIRASMLDYDSRIVNVQCLEVAWQITSAEPKLMGRAIAYRTADSIVSAGKSAIADGTVPPATSISIFRKNKDSGVEEFRLRWYLKSPSDSPDPSHNFFQSQKDWVISNEKLHDSDNSTFVTIHRKSIGILKALRFADGWNISVYDLIDSPNYNISVMDETKNSVKLKCDIIETPDGGPKNGIKSFKSCLISLKKESHWVVSESSYEYRQGHTRNGDIDRLNGKISISYITFNGISVPSEVISEITVVDQAQKKSVLKYKYEMQTVARNDTAPFALPTYGITERHLKPEATDLQITSSESSTVENIPVWAWLAGAGMAFMITGLIVVTFKRKAKAAA